jgi:BioD-like phosphotransacetylase family protein
VRENTLIITPGDRIDNIVVSIVACPAETGGTRPVAGLVLTGGFKPPLSIMTLLEASGIPVVLCNEDTYSVATQLRELTFKIRPEDGDKIEEAKELIRTSLDVPSLLAALREEG